MIRTSRFDLGEIEAAYTGQSAPVLMTVYRDRDGLERPNAVFDGTNGDTLRKGTRRTPPMRCDLSTTDSRYGSDSVVESMVPEGAVADLADLFKVLSESEPIGGDGDAGTLLRDRFPAWVEGSRVASAYGRWPRIRSATAIGSLAPKCHGQRRERLSPTSNPRSWRTGYMSF